eukprot:3910830-Lingulodinium_polyedra.AAC.1
MPLRYSCNALPMLCGRSANALTMILQCSTNALNALLETLSMCFCLTRCRWYAGAPAMHSP